MSSQVFHGEKQNIKKIMLSWTELWLPYVVFSLVVLKQILEIFFNKLCVKFTQKIK